MAVTYYALLTTIGAGKLANATALGTTLKITQLAVGDGGGNVPTPDASRTQLVNEVRRAPLNRLSVDPANSAQIIAEQVIPEDVGGWWIREMGLYDEAGALIAYANCAPSYKPQLAEGSGRTQTVRIVLIVSNAASVELKIDPSVVLATREYVDNSIVTALNRLDYKQSVRAATTASITLSGLQTLDGVALVAGDRVLVKNQTNAVDNGLYVVAAGAWKRATDADENSEVTPGLTVVVESGTSQADSIWQLVTDGAIVLGTTALAFQNITNGLAKLASPAFSGTPTAPTPAITSSDTSIATTAFTSNVLRSLGLGGNCKANGVANMNGANLGGIESYNGTESDAVANNWPVLGVAAATAVHYNVVTFGLGNRITQIAVQAYLGGNENRIFSRSKHDSTWSAWSEQAPLLSPKLAGNPTAPTPPQFDKDTSLSTTEFVQRALGNFSNQSSVNTTRALTLDMAGQIINCGNTITVTLPTASTDAVGATFQINNAGSGVVTVQAPVAQSLYGVGSAVARMFVLGAGDTVTVAYVGGNAWYGWGGIQLGASAGFAALQQSNGYQKLPSGLIFQWVTGISDSNGNAVVTLPVQFPTGFLGGVASEYSPTGWTANRATVWSVDQVASSKSQVAARVRDILGTAGPVLNAGIAGRLFVWGY
ncbi:phage tail protein [Pseudomonas sp. Pseusp97]|uniref:phage tail-collar fiber domain-containing protein n=1 Tax=Pseudomonas sp. Pseusp97 TaxID=3243065 RepID=UPI0039A55B42